VTSAMRVVQRFAWLAGTRNHVPLSLSVCVYKTANGTIQYITANLIGRVDLSNRGCANTRPNPRQEAPPKVVGTLYSSRRLCNLTRDGIY
jgi:hypothetical protein